MLAGETRASPLHEVADLDEYAPLGMAGSDDSGLFWLIGPAPSPSPRASVIVPARNAGGTLRRAVESALRQSEMDLEVLIVDDGSTDDTAEVITQLAAADPRVRPLRLKRNVGKSAAVNLATRAAVGRWVAILDADDWYHPDRLAALLAIGERERVDMVADNQFRFDAIADKVAGTAWPQGRAQRPFKMDQFIGEASALATFSYGMLKPVFRRKFILDQGVFYAERARVTEDFGILLLFFLQGGTAMISDSPYYYYQEPYGSISGLPAVAGGRRYDFRNAADMNEVFTSWAMGKLPPRQLASLRRRTSEFRALEQYHLLRDAIRSRSVTRAASLLSARSIWPVLVARGVARLRRMAVVASRPVLSVSA